MIRLTFEDVESKRTVTFEVDSMITLRDVDAMSQVVERAIFKLDHMMILSKNRPGMLPDRGNGE